MKVILISAGILVYTVIVVILTLAGFLAFLLYYVVNSEIIKDVGEYRACLNKIEDKSLIAHFPGEIPKNAKNPKLYCYPAKDDYDGALVFLTFETDKKYITEELQKFEFTDNSSRKILKNIYPIPSEKVDIPQKELTFYFFDDNPQNHKNGLPYFGGIGVDTDKTKILYYYFLPGD